MIDGNIALSVPLAQGTEYTVVVSSDNYANMTAVNTVTGKAYAELSDDQKSVVITGIPTDMENPSVSVFYTYENEAGETVEVAIAKDAAVTEDGTITLTEAIDPGVDYTVVISAKDKEAVTVENTVGIAAQNKGAEITQGSTEDVVVSTDRHFGLFKGFTIDGKELAEGTDFTAEEGSTIVTIKGTLASTLSVGDHKAVFVYGDGKNIETTIKVNAVQKEEKPVKETDKTSGSGNVSASDTKVTVSKQNASGSVSKSTASKAVNTGDATNAFLWIVLLAASAGIFILAGFRRKRTK